MRWIAMKMKKTVKLLLLPVLCLSLLFPAETEAGAAGRKAVKSVTVRIDGKKMNKKTFTLAKGEKIPLKVTACSSGKGRKITYQSGNPRIASVSKKGVVTAKKTGTVKITVKVKGKRQKAKKAWIRIKVKAKPKAKGSACKHSWREVQAKGHEETVMEQVPFSKAERPWTSDNEYVCMCGECRKYQIMFGTGNVEGALEHLREVNSPGWEEWIYEVRTLCIGCGKDLTSLDSAEFNAHITGCGGTGSNYESVKMKVGVIPHKAVPKKVYIQDREGYTYCVKCGKRR